MLYGNGSYQITYHSRGILLHVDGTEGVAQAFMEDYIRSSHRCVCTLLLSKGVSYKERSYSEVKLKWWLLKNVVIKICIKIEDAMPAAYYSTGDLNRTSSRLQ